MFTDPQSATIGSAVSLPRLTLDNFVGYFASSDGIFDLRLSHFFPKGRKRSVTKMSRKKISTNPLSDLKSEESCGITITIDRPSSNSFTEAELIELITGQFTWLTASTNANLKKLLGLES